MAASRGAGCSRSSRPSYLFCDVHRHDDVEVSPPMRCGAYQEGGERKPSSYHADSVSAGAHASSDRASRSSCRLAVPSALLGSAQRD